MIILKCNECRYENREFRDILCPICGGLMHPIHSFEWIVDFRENGLWRFHKLIPEMNNRITLGEGYTPLVESNRLLGSKIYFKDEGRNPTGSFRDRAAALIVSDALDKRVSRLVLASDGNMGVSIAAYSARSGLPATIYVPSWIDHEKLLLMKAFGSNVVIKKSSIDELLKTAHSRVDWKATYNASSTYNALSIEGLKTIAYEIYFQLSKEPIEIILPLGSGLTLISIFHGFEELYRNNLINNIPRLIGVETCGNPLYSSILKNTSKCSEESLTGLSYTRPLIYEHVLRIIEKYGDIVVVNRRKTINAAQKLASTEGLFVEPSSAVALAGALEIGLEEYTVIILTGHGLKGPSAYSEKTRSRSLTIFPGSTKYMILQILNENPGLTGYDIWKKLGIKISLQAIYQHLHELVDKKYLIVDKSSGLKKYYLNREINVF